MRDQGPQLFIDHLVMPDSSGSKIILVTQFRIEKSFLSFRRSRHSQSQTGSERFEAQPSVRISIREASNEENRDPAEMIIASNSWSETVFADTYEQTRSANSFVQNFLQTPLEPGSYRIETTVTSENRVRRHLSSVIVMDHTQDKSPSYFYFTETVDTNRLDEAVKLLNLGQNVYFGRDHGLIAWLPARNDRDHYTLYVDQLRIRRQDTVKVKTVYEKAISPDDLLTGFTVRALSSESAPALKFEQKHHSLSESHKNDAYLVKNIPNSTFENAPYRIRLVLNTPEGEIKTLVRKTYQNLWIDMPVSLLNLDVAIQMMRFIVDDDQMRSLRRGSRDERERKFLEFWRERNPVPGQEYNQLMVEFYRRIDYAYDHFTTPQKPGYESDQGQIYIRHGEPQRRERTFPSNQPARESWYYPGRVFVFEATTGFGDYQLIERK